MTFVIFHFTLVVLLVSIITSATCFSLFLVSRNRTMLFAFWVFLFYFFDVAWVFQDSLAQYEFGNLDGNLPYMIVRSICSIVAGGGVLISLWLLVCDYVGKTNTALKVIPGVIFVISSAATLIFIPPSDLQRFLFYTMRALLLFWSLIYLAYYYITVNDEFEKSRLRRHAGIYVVWWILGIAVVVEDALYFLVFSPADMFMWPRTYMPEKNYAENIFVLFCAFLVIKHAISSLSLRSERPLPKGEVKQDKRISENLIHYSQRYQLSEREQEVLHFILLGNDNQNIASSMHLALSTVKVHVHNILQKTGQANRQDLIKDFWKQ